MSKQLTAAVVGAGHRGVLYASYALRHPDELKVVAVAEPNDNRRRQVAAAHGIPPEMQFRTAAEFATRGALADAVINGTMDPYHVPTSLPLIEAGYHILLEKPIAPTETEVRALLAAARKHGRKVMICHVLRYAPFYAEIRRRVAAGEIGDLVSVQTTEHVSYHHMAVAFIRGRWAREDRSSSMLMSKCCHDLDLVTWMKSGIPPRSVASFGSLMQFKEENAPAGSGTRCLVDCQIERDCPYSARKHYIEQEIWGCYAWEPIEHLERTLEQKIESLRTDNPYGRCVWRCDNDVVDHQSLAIEFADGSTATHNMIGATSRPCRSIHLVGASGEIQGIMEEGWFVIRHPDPRKGHEYSEERVDCSVSGDGHGGGDLRLVEDFVRVVRGEKHSISTTDLEDSIYGHLLGFSADVSRLERRCVDIVL